MRSLAIVVVLLAPGPAAAETVNGSGALALAALVGNVSPVIAPEDRAALMKLLDGQEKLAVQPGQKIVVHADKITCRSSNIEIAAHSCALSFGERQANLTGRAAHELYATLAEIGVPPDGAAGSVYESLSNLACDIDPGEIIENAGTGARCAYAAPN